MTRNLTIWSVRTADDFILLTNKIYYYSRWDSQRIYQCQPSSATTETFAELCDNELFIIGKHAPLFVTLADHMKKHTVRGRSRDETRGLKARRRYECPTRTRSSSRVFGYQSCFT